jgi:arsenite oxidase small subunit
MSERPPEREPEEAAVDEERRRVATWLWRLPVLIAAGAASWGVYEGVRTHFFKRRPDPTPDFVDGPVVPVAPLALFDRDWAEATFQYGGTPALAVRLPGGIAGGLEVDGLHLAAFSRVCTHLGCIVALNRDAEAIAFAFNYRAEGPQLVCRCHLSVFDPERAGRAVAGPAIAPLPRVRLALDGDALVATGIEAAPEG